MARCSAVLNGVQRKGYCVLEVTQLKERQGSGTLCKTDIHCTVVYMCAHHPNGRRGREWGPGKREGVLLAPSCAVLLTK